MTDRYIGEYIRLIGSVSLNQSKKEHIVDYIVQKSAERKDLSGKHFVAASAVAVLAIGTFLIARGMKQDINIM